MGEVKPAPKLPTVQEITQAIVAGDDSLQTAQLREALRRLLAIYGYASIDNGSIPLRDIHSMAETGNWLVNPS